MKTRAFRSDQSYRAEKTTRAAIAKFLASRGFRDIQDSREHFGQTEKQVVGAIDESGVRVNMWVRLCWRRDGDRRGNEGRSAAQLRARIKNDDWIGTLKEVEERALSSGVTHLLLVQRIGSAIVQAASIPISSLTEIWTKQRDISAKLIARGALGARKKNHAMNGSSPTLWLRDESAPEVAEALWQFKGVRDLAALPMVEPDPSKESRNPDWVRDELILALDLYLSMRPNIPGKTSKPIRDLSQVLNQLGARLFRRSTSATFRNANGVYMKLMNFRRFDPTYTADGKKGLTRGNSLEQEVWEEFSFNPERCHAVAVAIARNIRTPLPLPELDGATEEAPEGKLLTRLHMSRERSRALVESRKASAQARDGVLRCECCGFDFATAYGSHGDGFIECHHTQPLASLAANSVTRLADLALLCANCHRMIHRRKRWLLVEELRAMLRQTSKPKTAALPLAVAVTDV